MYAYHFVLVGYKVNNNNHKQSDRMTDANKTINYCLLFSSWVSLKCEEALVHSKDDYTEITIYE